MNVLVLAGLAIILVQGVFCMLSEGIMHFLFVISIKTYIFLSAIDLVLQLKFCKLFQNILRCYLKLPDG